MQAAQGSGVEDVFLYSKALMRQNAPAPLPEHLAPVSVSGVWFPMPDPGSMF